MNRHRSDVRNIDFTLFDGKKSTIAEGIKDKQEAEWLIAKMSSAIGRKHP